MKKILKIANYDFKRLALNPITYIVAFVLLGILLLTSFVYDIPTTENYSAVVLGDNTRTIYSNFKSDSTSVDTQTSLDALIDEAKTTLQVFQNGTSDFTTLSSIDDSFSKISENIKKYINTGSCSYSEENDISEITTSSETLEEFVENYSKLGQLESDTFIKKDDFENLKNASQFFKENSSGTVDEVLEALKTEIQKDNNSFDIVASVKQSASKPSIDADVLQEIEDKYITKAEEKKTEILSEIRRRGSTSGADDESISNMTSLITNYKLTCENAKYGVTYQLQLILEKLYGNLDKFYGCSQEPIENLETYLAKINFYLADDEVYYTNYQHALNFNIASTQVTMFDHAYFCTCIVGLVLVIFGIFCAYKLFGIDRKNGKMDLLLAQDVTFNQVFTAKFLAIVFSTAFYLLIFAFLTLIWGYLIFGSLETTMLAVFNATTAYTISPLLFFIIKIVGIELQVIFYAVMTIFIMNISRKFNLTFAISLAIYVVAFLCNIFLNGSLVYCLLPFIHADITSFLGGATMQTGFLKTSLYVYGNFYISLGYYLVVVVLLFSFTRQLFKKN